MDAEEHEQLDLDFESMLNAALGIENSPVPQQDVHSHASPQPSRMQHHTQHMIVGSPVSYDQVSPSSSPTASPVHHHQPSPCSPCTSSTSMHLHASIIDYSSGHAQSVNMYSPVRGSGSPPPDQYSPIHQPPVTKAAMKFTSHTAPLQSQQQKLQQQQHRQQRAMQPLHFCDRANAAQPPELQQQGPAQHQPVQICALPREVQMRVVCFLSADALTELCCCNRQMRALCDEPVLWRRLFVHRWGRKVRQSNALSWKVRYMERDGAELRAAGAAVHPRDAMQDMFVQAMLAKRQQAISRAAVDDLMLVDDDEIAAKVAAWRKSRGFDQSLDRAGAPSEPPRPSDLTQHLPTNPGHTQNARLTGLKRPGVVRRRGSAPTTQQHQRLTPEQKVAQQDGSSVSGCGQQGFPQPIIVSNNEASVVGPSSLSAAAGSLTHVKTGATVSSAPERGRSEAANPHQASTNSIAAAAAAAADSERVAKRQRRRWTQIGSVFCDELTGWIHVCDETCSEKIVEPSSGLLVCPISGSVSDRMMTCAEEEAEDGPRDGHEGNNGQAEDDFSGEKGRLARAFAAGYYCSDEKELLQTCGVRLSR